MTPAQLTVFKAHLLANTATLEVTAGNFQTIADIYAAGNQDHNGIIADWYNLFGLAATHTVWKNSVTITEIGNNFVGTELEGLSTLQNGRLQTIAQYSPSGIDPSLPDRRAFFDGVFSGAGGVATRAKLLILWKRLGRTIEKVLGTGTGTDASPITMGFIGLCMANDVQATRSV